MKLEGQKVLGHGIDLVEVEAIASLLERHAERFCERCFTPDEVAYCRRSQKRAAEHFAVRFAAKEAVFKALGTGRRHGMAWTDVAVHRLPTGEPKIVLTGVAAEFAAERGIASWSVSLSHTHRTAAASVVALG
ncbi:MAG: holo-ACP synthase [Planctomycetota bacterium]